MFTDGMCNKIYGEDLMRVLPETQIICISGVNHCHCEERSNLEFRYGLYGVEIASFLAKTTLDDHGSLQDVSYIACHILSGCMSMKLGKQLHH